MGQLLYNNWIIVYYNSSNCLHNFIISIFRKLSICEILNLVKVWPCYDKFQGAQFKSIWL